MRAIRWVGVALLAALWGAPAAAQYGPPGQVNRYDATDFPGGDLGGAAGRARSFDECAQRCVADGRCNAFTYNLNTRNCIPKSGAGEPQRNDRAVSGVVERRADDGNRPGRPGRLPVARYDATDFPGNDIDGTLGRARSFDDCAQRCLGDGRCSAFTFNLNNGNCIPKSSAGAPERNGRAVSGVVLRGAGGPGGSGGSGSCSAGGAGSCPGCSVSCAPSQRPVCEAAIEGFGGPCLRESSCRCLP